jgi:hypothetical protein
MVKGSWSVVTVNKGLARPDMKLKLLENAFALAGFFQGGNQVTRHYCSVAAELRLQFFFKIAAILAILRLECRYCTKLALFL